MPQFDILTIGSQIFSVLIFLYFLYYFNIKSTIPSIIEVKKFRTKKLIKNQEKTTFIKNCLNNNLKYTYYFYKIFLS